MQKVRKTETERCLDRQKYTFQRTTTLHPGPIRQTEIIIVAENYFYAALPQPP